MKISHIQKLLKPKTPFTKVFSQKPIIGSLDSLSLLSAGVSIAATSPVLIGSTPTVLAGSLGAIASTIGIMKPRLKEAFDPVDLESRDNFVLPSSPIPKGDGIIAGYTMDTNEPVRVPYDYLMRHVDLIGASGVGKTTLGMFMLWQNMVNNGGFIMIDAKIDVDTKDTIGYLAKSIGRERDLYILNVDDPENSNTYNPLLNGDADEVASRLLNLIPSTENNPGSDHYRQLANHALTAIIGGLKAAKLRYHFDDLITVLQSSSAMQSLVGRVPVGSKERKNLEIFLDKYRKLERGEAVIDIAKIKTEIGGLAGRMAQFSQGKFGEIFNTYTPEIDLFDIIKNKKMLYVMLPTMGKGTAATNLAKMILSDLMSAVYKVQGLPKAMRPWPPFPIFADEFGRYAIAESAILFEQARSAQIYMMPGFQGYGNLEEVSESFADMVLQSSWCKALFRFGSDTSAERSAEIIGKMKRYQPTITESDSESDGSQFLQVSPQSTKGDGMGVGEAWREVEEHRVSTDKLKSIPIGQCIFLIGADVYHLKIPRLTTPIDTERQGEKRKKELVFNVMRRRVVMPYSERGLDIAKNYEKFLLCNSPEAQQQKNRETYKKKKEESARKDDDKAGGSS